MTKISANIILVKDSKFIRQPIEIDITGVERVCVTPLVNDGSLFNVELDRHKLDVCYSHGECPSSAFLMLAEDARKFCTGLSVYCQIPVWLSDYSGWLP